MLDILKQLVESKLFHASRLELHVVPKHKTLALNGFIRLRNYASIENEDARFTGEESRQIKVALRKTLGSDCIIEVKLEPNVQQFKGGAYFFSITRNFSDKKDLDLQLAQMIEDGTLSDHAYHVHSKWAGLISGGHAH